jgi:Domain of unknown function (DUF4340)
MKKINNKILIVALVGLVGVFVLSRLFRSPGLESNLRKDLVVLDSTAVTEIRILPSNARDQVIKLARAGNRWTVERENKKYDADASSVKSILGMLGRVDAERMVSRKKDKWETYNVGEKSTHITIYYGADQKASLHIGKSGFNQGSSGGMYGGGAYTYVRLSDENEVYVVNGFFESAWNRPFNDWRNKSFLRIPRDLIKKISFRYPADSSFVLEKKDSLWMAGTAPVDKVKMDSFLGQLASKNLTSFADDFVASAQPDAVVQVEGAEGTLGTIEAWRNESNWILRSSLQKEIFFSGAGASIDKDVLVGMKSFLPK